MCAYRSNTPSAYGVVNPEYFKKNFSVDSFLVSLTKDAINTKAKPAQQSEGSAVVASARASLDRVQQLLKLLDRAEEGVSQLNLDVTRKVAELQRTVDEDEGRYKAEVRSLEKSLERVKASIRDVDTRVGRISQTATRVGDRLATADGGRARALEAMELIAYMQAFSVLQGDNFGDLPVLFTDDNTMAEAAAVSRRLSSLAAEVQSAKQRTKLVTNEGGEAPASNTPGSTGGYGSIEHTVQALERYCNWLENRVVAYFDQAVAESHAPMMAACVRIMAQFDRERTIAQRWVASRPIFLDSREEAHPTGTGSFTNGSSSGTDSATKELMTLYKDLYTAVKEDVALLRQIFPSQDMVLELFMQRLYEQRVQAALERLIGPPPSLGADAATQQARLRLLADAYGRTQQLTQNLGRAIKGSAVDMGTLSEGLFPAFLAGYPAQELQWLQAAFEQETSDLDSLELSLPLATKLLNYNKEATARAAKLSAPRQLPCNARALFHSAAPPPLNPSPGASQQAPPAATAAVAAAAGAAAQNAAHPGCLLEQLKQLIISGVEYSLDLCNATSRVFSILKMGFGSVNRASSSEMAEAFINERIRKVLEATHMAGNILGLLQQHFSEVVLPAVAPSVADHSACSAALLALMRGVEDSVLGVLRKCVDAFFVQLEKALSTEQRRSDFTPRDDAVTFDKPTGACMLATAMLYALNGAARDCLEGSNLSSFVSEVGHRVYTCLVAHMTRFSYSPTGALKWKKDCAEYADCLRVFEVAPVNDQFAHLQQIVNVLIVAPDSLLGLVNGTLRLPHRDALRFIALREDFKTARVDGKSLAQLFAGEGMEKQMGAAAGSKK